MNWTDLAAELQVIDEGALLDDGGRQRWRTIFPEPRDASQRGGGEHDEREHDDRAPRHL